MPFGASDASSPQRFNEELDEQNTKKKKKKKKNSLAFKTNAEDLTTTTAESSTEPVEPVKTNADSLNKRNDLENDDDDDSDSDNNNNNKKKSRGHFTSETTKMLLAGGVAGAFSKSCTAPLARLTILKQLEGSNAVPGWTNSQAAKQDLGIIKSLRHIVQTEGVKALWKGNGVTIAHRLPYSAINFYTYENTLDFLENEVESRFKVKDYQAWEVTKRLAAGAFAGCFSCTLVYPLDLVRTRLAAQVSLSTAPQEAASSSFNSAVAGSNKVVSQQQQQQQQQHVQSPPHYKGIVRSMKTIVSEEGVRGLYRGLPPTLVGVGPNLAINFAAYETLRNYFGNNTGDFGKDNPMLISLACGSTSAVVSASATFPLDLVRRRMQMRDATRGDTFLGVLKRVIKKEGFTGLYRGIYPEFAKVVPGVSITYATYELLKRLAGVDTGRM